jgi:hypothetical protein
MKRDQLHELIHSLSPSEKRYFKLFSSFSVKEEGNNYMRLFDCIEAMPEFSATQLEEKFGQEKFYKQIHVAKNYLYNSILKSLRNFHEAAHPVSAIRNLLIEAEILAAKGLYQHADRILDRAEKIALENELFLSELDIIGTRSEIQYTTGNNSFFSDYDTAVFDREKALLQRIGNENDYKHLFYGIARRLRAEGRPRTPEQLESYNTVFSQDLLSNEMKALSTRSHINFLKAHGAYHMVCANFETADAFHAKIVQLLEEHTAILLQKPEVYLFALNNLVITKTKLGQFESASNALEKIKAMTVRYKIKAGEDWNTKIFSIAAQLETELALRTNRKENLPALENYIQSGLIKFERTINAIFLLVLRFNMASVYFQNQYFPKANQWLVPMLNESSRKLREDIYNTASIMQMLVILEKGDFDLLDYSLNNYKRRVKNSTNTSGTEAMMVRLLKEICKKPGDLKTLLSEAHQELQHLKKQKLEEHFFDNLDLEKWMKQKINQLD